MLNRLLGEGTEWLIYVVEIGVFFVIFAVMLPVEITEVSHDFRKVKPTALALFVNFLFIPFFSYKIAQAERRVLGRVELLLGLIAPSWC